MLAVRLPEATEKKLSYYAKLTQSTKTDVVKEALGLYLDARIEQAKKTPWELGEDFFGQYRSGRDDLSTTYKQKIRDKLDAKYRSHR